MPTQLADITVTVNNAPIGINPNSFKYTEGLGEQKVRSASFGGGAVEQIFSNDIENNFSMVSFELPATIGNIALLRSWKVNRNQNLIQAVGQTPEGALTRVFTQAAILNDYEVELGSETNISVEFKSNPAS